MADVAAVSLNSNAIQTWLAKEVVEGGLQHRADEIAWVRNGVVGAAETG